MYGRPLSDKREILADDGRVAKFIPASGLFRAPQNAAGHDGVGGSDPHHCEELLAL